MIVFFAATRALHFASLMMVFGASAFSTIAAKRVNLAPISNALRKWLVIAAIIALVTSAICLGFVTGQMAGDSAAAFDLRQISVVAGQTDYGHVFLTRAALLAGLILLAIVNSAAWLRAVLSGAALALLGIVSHAAARGGDWRLALAANDGLHLLCAGFWIGALVVLAMLIRTRSADIVAALRIFSGWAIIAVALLVMAGSVNAAAILYQPGMTWSGVYLGWLAAKLVLAALMIALALTNRFGILPAMVRGDKESAESLTMTVVMELSCAALILLVVGILGETAPMAM
ncbi:MAG TPA: CopD family protein [Bradyrhizobium sp.]